MGPNGPNPALAATPGKRGEGRQGQKEGRGGAREGGGCEFEWSLRVCWATECFAAVRGLGQEAWSYPLSSLNGSKLSCPMVSAAAVAGCSRHVWTPGKRGEGRLPSYGNPGIR